MLPACWQCGPRVSEGRLDIPTEKINGYLWMHQFRHGHLCVSVCAYASHNGQWRFSWMWGIAKRLGIDHRYLKLDATSITLRGTFNVLTQQLKSTIATELTS
jgi:hypothetical protein